MSIQHTWRCAVLRGWASNFALPLTSVAAIAWEEGATLNALHVRWMPSITADEALAEESWRSRLYTADGDLPVSEFLAFHETNPSLDVLYCAVPADAQDLGGAADLVLDEVLLSAMWEADYDVLSGLNAELEV